MATISSLGKTSNLTSSDVIFVNLRTTDTKLQPIWQGADWIFLCAVLLAWVGAVLLFMHKWEYIRVVQPRDLLYKSLPKNVERVNIVEEPEKSVLSKEQTKRMSVTMATRQEHLRQLNRTLSFNTDDRSVAAHHWRLRKLMQTTKANMSPMQACWGNQSSVDTGLLIPSEWSNDGSVSLLDDITDNSPEINDCRENDIAMVTAEADGKNCATPDIVEHSETQF